MNTPPPVSSLGDDEFQDLVRRAVSLPAPPAAWMKAALEAWQYREHREQAAPQVHATARQAAPAATLPGLVAQAIDVVRRFGATLTFDSWAASPLATGLRGLRSDTRQFLFSSEGRDIDLRIAAVGESYSLGGQLLGPDETGTVELRAEQTAGEDGSPALGHAAIHHAVVDQMGEFHIAGVAPGSYVLTLQLSGDQITLPPMQVGPPAE